VYGTSVDKVATALEHSGLILPGGVTTSLIESGQQWDFPNGWPPLQHMLIEGLDTAQDGQGVQDEKDGQDASGSEAKVLAKRLATIWVEANFIAFNATGGHMFEKYNTTEPGARGGGGEYNLQTGFGWTNGVLLSLLARWPNLKLAH